MKILKNAEQRNFIVNRDNYELQDLYNLFKNGYIVCFTCNKVDGYDYVLSEKAINSTDDIAKTDIFRIYAANCKSVKVVYNTLYGFYENVVETNDGTQIAIVL